MGRVSRLLVCSTFIVTAACQALAPVAPAPVPAAIVILHSGATHLSYDPHFSLSAFLVDTDGLYTDVTDKAQWTVSDSSILRDISGAPGVSANGHPFLVLAPGAVNVLASYQGLAGVIPIAAVQYSGFSGPVTLNSLGLAGVLRIQRTLQLSAYNLQGSNVSAAASWASSDPSVATVDHGVVTGVRVGTTTVTTTFGGGTDSIAFSVYPSQQSR
jgi:hypothetical protein